MCCAVRKNTGCFNRNGGKFIMMKLCLDMNNCHLTEKTFNGLNSNRKSYA